MNKDIFIFLGPPGSGKGSLSQLCVKRLGWKQLSTGNLCRDHIARGTEIGKQIDFAIKSGKLVTDSLIIQMVQEWLDTIFDDSGAVIFDGFPRVVSQAHALNKLVSRFEGVRVHPLRLVLPDEEIVYRLLARSICQNNKCQRVYSMCKKSSLRPKNINFCNECKSPLTRRSDDEEEAIYERLRIHHEHEKTLLDFYADVDKPVRTIRVNLPLEDVYADFIEKVRLLHE